MAYPYLPVSPCCTDVVINDVCGCSSTIVNTGCVTNNPCSTVLTASSTIVYNGPALSCITAEPCDTLNVVLQKIDEIICNLLSQINILTTQVTNINTQVLGLTTDIVDIYDVLDVCCPVTTTTTTTCNPASTHPFPIQTVSGTDTIPYILFLLSNACNAAACLQDFSCSITSGNLVYWDVEVPGVGDKAYGSNVGCSVGLIADGYYVIDYSGTYTVVEIINSTIVSFPTC